MSNILETFFVLFKSDNEDLNKGAKEAERTLDDLDDTIKKADESSVKLGENFGKLVGKTALWIGAVSGIGTSLSAAFSVGFADKIHDQAEAVGISVENYSAWTSAMEKAGGSAASFEKTIGGLNEKLFEITQGGKGNLKPFFDRLGISVYDAAGKMRDSLDLLPEIADKFQNISQSDAEGLAKELGIDGGSLLLLRQGRMAVEEQIKAEKRLGVVRTKDAEAADKFKDSATEFGRLFKVMGSRLMHIVLPPLTKLFEILSAMASWAAGNGRFLATFFAILSSILITMFAPAIWGAVTALGAMAIAVVAATWPFLAIGAAIAAAALIIEDLWAFFSGAPSVTAKLIQAFKGILPGLTQPFKDAYEYITGWFSKITGLVSKVKGLLKFGKNDAAAEAQIELNAAANNGLAGQSSASISNGADNSKRTNIDVGEIKIETQATDADGISKAIDQSLQNQINQTSNDYDDGVAG